MLWPADGRMTPARGEARGATVVFLHHFGGKRSSTRRHQDVVTALGFDAYAFSLARVEGEFAPFRVDLIHTWAHELATVLDATPGPKVIYSLSFPSMAVACLLGERDRADVRGWICDGGPFRHVIRCMWNYFAQEAAEQSAPWRALRTAASYVAVGGPRYDGLAARWVSRLRPKFPVLSLRSADDRLVPAAAIDRVFAENPRLDLDVVEFPACGHLEGIVKQPKAHAREVARFLDHCVPERA